MDLHTFEPGGQHVNFEAKEGSAGALDVDNTYSDGPEHYTANCEVSRIRAGDYRFGVNNWSWTPSDTPVTLQIASALGGELFTATVPAGPVRNNLGQLSPVMVVTVSVAKDANDKWQATLKR